MAQSSKDDLSRVIPMSPADAGRMSQGERIGTMEKQLANYRGILTTVGSIFGLFAVAILSIFLNTYSSAVGLTKDMEIVKTYLKEDKVKLDDASRTNDELKTRVLKLESRNEYLEKELKDHVSAKP